MSVSIKEVFELLANYNSTTNQKVIKILGTIDPIKLTEDLGSYYGSILGLLNHHLSADIGWLRILGPLIPSLDFISPLLEQLPKERLAPKKLYWKTLEKYKTVRTEVDTILERVVKSITPEEYTSILKIVGFRRTIEKPTWRILLHLFNHHTHHRGGVSLLLDQLHVENDYSNLL